MCSDWGLYVASVTLPKYMNDVLRFNIDDIGLYNSMPWLLANLLAYGFGYTVDKAVRAKKISVTNSRKMAVFLCEWRQYAPEVQPF